MKINLQPDLSTTLYEQDFYLWVQTTTQLLKEHRFDEVDLNNLIEEMKTMGRTERKEIKSQMVTIIEHLLKLIYWESKKADNARGWINTIVEQRNQLEFSLEDSPSLKLLIADLFPYCYQKARKTIIKKYDLPEEMFPTEPPFSLEDVLNFDYLPS